MVTQIDKQLRLVLLFLNLQSFCVVMASGQVNFLKKQNSRLREEITDLNQLLSINKEALRLSIKFKEGQINFPKLVELLYEENMKLLFQIHKLKSELEAGHCNALISEQIAFASTEHEQYLTNQLKSKLIKLKKQLEARQKKILELQKNRGDNQKHTDIRIIEISQPQMEEIDRKKLQIMKVKDQRDEFMKLNIILTKQITQLKSMSAVSTKSKAQQKIIGSPDMSRFIKYQKKLVMNNDDNDLQDSIQSGIESEQQNLSDESAEEPQQKSVLNNTKMQAASKISVIPKLELTRAKEIQQLIVKKINNDEKKKNNSTNKEEKYKTVENQLRKRIGTLMIDKINEQRQNGYLKRIINELQQRNIMLIQDKKVKQEEMFYEERIQRGEQTLLDICRDVTMNERLKEVIDGTLQIPSKNVICNQY